MKVSIKAELPNFSEGEFKCPCGCGKVDIDGSAVYILQFLRNKLGKPVKITCGCRCQKYNDSLVGSLKASDHIKGKAVDFQIQNLTSTLAGRKTIMEMMRSLPGYKYSYCNGLLLNADGSTKVKNAPNMGNSIHLSVK